MSADTIALLAILQQEAERAGAAETEFRREAAARSTTLARQRSFAYRRLNLLRAIIDAIKGAEDSEDATARAGAALRQALGWSGDSDAQTEVIDRFLPVALSLHGDEAAASEADQDVRARLAAFEEWYEATHAGPFWMLFDHYVTETPLVDF